jgi:hypothetical protein
VPNSAVRWSLSFLSSLSPLSSFTVLALCVGTVAQSTQKPFRASEVLALEAGGALQANVAHDIAGPRRSSAWGERLDASSTLRSTAGSFDCAVTALRFVTASLRMTILFRTS